MKVAIVEDNRADSEVLENHIRSYCFQTHTKLELETFTSAEDFFATWPIELDILFLDILLDKMNGIEIASKIRQTNERVIIIFITNNPQFSLAGYTVDALDYLIKPISQELLHRIFAKAIHRLGNSFRNCFTISNNDGYYVITPMDIQYIELLNRKLIIHTKHESIVCFRSLQYMEEQLPKTFFRCHSAFLINLHAVESVRGSDVVVAGKMIPISKHRRKEFIKALIEFVGEKL